MAGTKTVIKASTADQTSMSRASGKQMVMNSSGRLWTGDVATGTITWYYSDNNGQSWTAASSTYATGMSGNNDAWAIDINDNDDIFLVYRGGINQRAELEVFTESANDLTASGGMVFTNTAISANQGVDICVMPDPSTAGDYYVHCASGLLSGSSITAQYFRFHCTSTYTLTVSLAPYTIATQTYGTEPQVAPRVDWTHQGDGLTPVYASVSSSNLTEKEYSVGIIFKIDSTTSISNRVLATNVLWTGSSWTSPGSSVVLQASDNQQDTGLNEICQDITFDGMRFWTVATDSRGTGGADNNIHISIYNIQDGAIFRSTYAPATYTEWDQIITINSSSTVSTTAIAIQAFPGRPDPDQAYHGYVRIYAPDADDSKIYYCDISFPDFQAGAWTLLEDTTYSGYNGIRVLKHKDVEILYWTEPNGANWDKVCNYYQTSWTTSYPKTANQNIVGQAHPIAEYTNNPPVENHNINGAFTAPWDVADNGVMWVAGQTDHATAASRAPAVWYSDNYGKTWNSATAPTCSVWDGTGEAFFRRDNGGYAYYIHVYDTGYRDVHIHKGDFNAARTAITWDNTNVIDCQSVNPSGQQYIAGINTVQYTDSTGDNYILVFKGETNTTYGVEYWWAAYHQTGGSGTWTTDKSPTSFRNEAANQNFESLSVQMEYDPNVDMYEPASDTPDIHLICGAYAVSNFAVYRFETATFTVPDGGAISSTAEWAGSVLYWPGLGTTYDIIRYTYARPTTYNMDAPVTTYTNTTAYGTQTPSMSHDGYGSYDMGMVHDRSSDRLYTVNVRHHTNVSAPYRYFPMMNLYYTDDMANNTTAWTREEPRLLMPFMGHAGTTGHQRWNQYQVSDGFHRDANVVKHIGMVWRGFARPSNGKYVSWWWSAKYFNSPPTPTITVPTDGATFDVENSLSITWTISDPEGDPQAYYTLKRVVDGTTTTYWNGSSWDSSESASTKIATASKTVILGKNWADAGVDTSHAYSVKVWDDVNSSAGPYSSTVTIYPISSQSTVKGYSLPRPIKRQQDINATLRSNQDYSVSWINTYVPAYGDLNDDLYIRAGVRPGGTSYMRDALPAVVGSFDVGNGTNYYATLGATDVYRTNEYALSSERAKRFRPKRMNDALGIIIGVDVFEYEYKDEDRNGAHASRFGLVAEDLGYHMRRLLDIRQEDNPLLLVKDGTIYLNDQQLIPIMWQAIQELYDIVQDLIPPGQRKERKPIVPQERRVKNE